MQQDDALHQNVAIMGGLFEVLGLGPGMWSGRRVSGEGHTQPTNV